MDDGYGIPAPAPHRSAPHREPVRYVVVIDAAGSAVVRLFNAHRELVSEVDNTEEIAWMTHGLQPVHAAQGPEWDRALGAHSAQERAAADVYTLEV
jgi:hypothetical protein